MTIPTASESLFAPEASQIIPFEVIDSKELARGLVLPESWVPSPHCGRLKQHAGNMHRDPAAVRPDLVSRESKMHL